MPRFPFLILIRLYQLTIARFIPVNTCRFYPTCSHYSYEAIAKHGLLKGGLMSIWRVLRCNPFCRGGYDPVP
ncbi:MAG: membrane protein insertion efficiency factor YidD [Anaerolineales bacterium]|nr:membrane protein insertion efficiency factor YidD [Anaerolineales bacterium]